MKSILGEGWGMTGTVSTKNPWKNPTNPREKENPFQDRSRAQVLKLLLSA